MVRKFILPIIEEITNEIIFDLYQKHQTEASRIRKMKRYYKNQNDIMNREYEDPNKPANKLAHNYAAYITNSYTGYFMGNPVTYKSENQALLDQLNDIFMYNDEADENTTVATEQSICGYAYEIVYTDEDGENKPITEKVVMPVIEGAVITAQGAENASIKSSIVSAVEAVTGLAVHKIQVFEMGD